MDEILIELHAMKIEFELTGCWYMAKLIGDMIKRDYSDELIK